MAKKNESKNVRKSAKGESAEKRKTQKTTKASKGKGNKPTLAASKSKVAKGCSQTSRSTPGANAQSQQAAEKNGEERQGILKRFIETLKRVIGYKKGERDEFRYNYDEKHPGYIFREEQGKLKSFGVTHSDVTFGKKNMPLEENPDPKDNRSAYIRNGVITSKKKRNAEKNKSTKPAGKKTCKPKTAKPAPVAPAKNKPTPPKTAKLTSPKTTAKSTEGKSYTVKQGRTCKTFATKSEAQAYKSQCKNKNVTITEGTKKPTHRVVKFTAKK